MAADGDSVSKHAPPLPGYLDEQLSWPLIQQVTAARFGLTRSQMLSRSRVQRCVMARQIAMLLCLEMVGTASLPQVGRWFGRDHTTVRRARDVTRARIAADPRFAKAVQEIRQVIITASEPTTRHVVGSPARTNSLLDASKVAPPASDR